MLWECDGSEYDTIKRESMKIRKICRYANCTNSEHWNEEFTLHVPLNAQHFSSLLQSKVAVNSRITPLQPHSDTQVEVTSTPTGPS
jgi:hypothetical protein